MKRLVYAATSPMTLDKLMVGHLRFMKDQGFDVTAIASPGPELGAVSEREGVSTVGVPMRRALSPLHDVLALWRLTRLLRRLQPDIINAGTPKAGLLCMIASWLVRVPVRIYTVRGLKGETATGWRRWLLEATERVASHCATDVICVSHSLSELYLERRLARRSKVRVLGHGSSNGIDLGRFWATDARRRQARHRVGLDEGHPVVGFVGRLVKDKGICELVEAFETIRLRLPGTTLLLAGGYEDGDAVQPTIRARIEASPDIIRLGSVADTAELYPAFDVLAFPSAREGLPNAPLEAAANGIPTVAFDATGTRDAVVSGHTGTLVQADDVGALADGLVAYLEDPFHRIEHGENAMKFVAEHFGHLSVWVGLKHFYDGRLGCA